jgi:hypothetical protein
MKLPANKEPRRTVNVRRGWRGSLSLPPPGGNGLDFYNTIRTHETDASVELLRAMFDVGYFPPNTPPDE